MTSLLIVSDQPLAAQANVDLLHAGMLLTQRTLEEIDSACDAVKYSAIILWDVGDRFDACMKKITAISPTPSLTHVLLGKELTRDQRCTALESGVHHIHGCAPDRELALILRNIARLLAERSAGTNADLNLRPGDPEGDWVLDQQHWHLRTPLGHDVQLQRAEAAILAQLFAQTGVQQSRESLAASFKSDHEDKNRSLDVAISKIRKKVRDASDLGLPLRAIRGVGYVFVGNAHIVSGAPSS